MREDIQTIHLTGGAKATIYNAAVRFSFANNELNQFGLYYEGPDGYADIGLVAEHIGVVISTGLTAAQIPTFFSFREVYFNDLRNAGPGVTVIPDAFPYDGSAPNDTLGPRITANFKITGAEPQYPIRNMVQWPYVFEDWQNQGNLNLVAFAPVDNILGRLVTESVSTTAGTYAPVMYSATHDQTNTALSHRFNPAIGVNKRRLR